MNVRPYATAKVRYEEFSGNVELSTTYASDSPIEFMAWLTEAAEFYRARLRFEKEYHYVRWFIVDYRMGTERGSVMIGRSKNIESRFNLHDA